MKSFCRVNLNTRTLPPAILPTNAANDKTPMKPKFDRFG
jgi:hypothetical protein